MSLEMQTIKNTLVLHNAAKYLNESQIKQLVDRGYEKDIVDENNQYPFTLKELNVYLIHHLKSMMI